MVKLARIFQSYFQPIWYLLIFFLLKAHQELVEKFYLKKLLTNGQRIKLLRAKKLVFLLFLRDPNIKNLLSLESLIQYLFNSTELVST